MITLLMTSSALVADTLATRAPGAVSISVTQLVMLVGSMLGTGVTLLGLGALFGRHQEFKEHTQDSINTLKADLVARITVLERSDGHSITREEMNARFGECTTQIEAINKRFDDFMVMAQQLIQARRNV